MDPPPAASDFNSGAVVLRKPEHRALLPAPPPPEALRGPGLTISRIADRIGNSILRPVEKKLFHRVGPEHWRSHIENLFGDDKEREKALGELHGLNPNCLSGRLKPLGNHCHALLKLARPGDTTVNTQLITFKILVAMITRYPGVRRTLHADKELRRVSATDPSLCSVWKRPHQDCGEEWSFYRDFVVFCMSNDAFQLTKLVETEPPHRLSRITLANQSDKVPIEELLGHAGDGPEFHFSRLCAIRYLAGILEFPSFWQGFPSDTRAKRERQRFLDVLSGLCTTILQLLEDSGGNAADMSVGPSPSMNAGRTAVEVLSRSLLYGLCRLRNLNNLPPRAPASLRQIVSILLRDQKSFERAFELAKEVNSLFDSSPTSPHDDEDPSDAPDIETASGAADRVSRPGGDDPSDAHDTEQASDATDRVSRPGGKDPSDVHNTETASGATDRVSRPGGKDPSDVHNTETASGAADRVSPPGRDDPSDTHDTEQASGATDRVSRPGGKDPSDVHNTETASGPADRVSPPGGDDPSDAHDTEQANGAADRVSPPGRDDPSDAPDTEQASGATDRVSRLGGKDPSDTHDTEQASGAADRVSPPGRDDPSDAPDTEQASGATDRVSRLGGKDPSDAPDTEQASGAADRVSRPGRDDPSDMHDTEQASGAADRVSQLGGDGGLGQAMKLPKPDILLDETSMQNGAYLESPKMDPGSKDHSEGTGGVLRPLIESHSTMRPTRVTYSDVVRGGTQGH
ncbi:hypothetical protein B0H11DRAFT_2292982, partial [Mycena galericulata]